VLRSTRHRLVCRAAWGSTDAYLRRVRLPPIGTAGSYTST